MSSDPPHLLNDVTYALAWVERVVDLWSASPIIRGHHTDLRFDLDTPSFSHTFPDPSAEATADSGVEVRYWTRCGGGDLPEWQFYERFCSV